jgi:hypothetical protein
MLKGLSKKKTLWRNDMKPIYPLVNYCPESVVKYSLELLVSFSPDCLVNYSLEFPLYTVYCRHK